MRASVGSAVYQAPLHGHPAVGTDVETLRAETAMHDANARLLLEAQMPPPSVMGKHPIGTRPATSSRPARAPDRAPRPTPASRVLDLREIRFGGRGSVVTGDDRRPLLIVPLEGSCLVEQGSNRIDLPAGELLLLEAGSPARVSAVAGARQIWLRLPSTSLATTSVADSPARAETIRQGPIDAGNGIGLALQGLATTAALAAAALTEAEAEATLAAILTLIDAAFPSVGTAVPGIAPGRCAPPRVPPALVPLQQTIEGWLPHPALSPALVAAAHGISTRQLHRLFKQAGLSFGTFVRRRRLERCRDDLVDPRLRGLAMTEIAYRWGFSDSSHFSRCFRAAFGCTARAYRARHDRNDETSAIPSRSSSS